MDSAFHVSMSRSIQSIHISSEDIFAMTGRLNSKGYSLIHITCTDEAGRPMLTYTFDHNSQVIKVSFIVNDERIVASITKWYSYAYIHENEIHDNHGILFHGVNVDFKGLLYTMF